MRIILASSSPRRNELMKLFNLPFEVMVEPTDEKIVGNNHYLNCMNIAKEKALKVFEKIDEDVIVIASDTMVIYEDKVYGKPKNYSDAYKMLKEFNDHKHEVISSLCLLIRKDNQVYEELTYDKCDVYVDKMSDDEIKEWINSNDVYSKAGAYAIQDGFGRYIKGIKGDYFSIVGLPIHKLNELLKKYL